MPIEISDKKLIEEFLAGDDASFSVLLQRYLKPVYNFVYQLTGDRSAVDDITQETFIKAWKNIKKFDCDRNFKTWIFTIAKNTAYDHNKKKKTIPFSRFMNEEGNSILSEIEEDKILPDEILHRADLAQELEEKLEQIPVPYKIILTLHYKEDLSFQEISQILGKPYNTIKSQHTRALKALRNVLVDKRV
ncbi:MAG: RNA polymerase sigma factor [Parcubacteria group bacterium]|jgi:RNA polymerase sigma-70 factor (ECF subfamily)